MSASAMRATAKRTREALLALGALIAASPADAKEEPICADRPGLATPACTVPEGSVQIETGFVDWTHDHAGQVETDALTIGRTAIKFGLNDRLDVEVDVSPYSRLRERTGPSAAVESGFGDVELAAKYRLTDSGSVQVALCPSIKVPTAHKPLGNGTWEGGLIVPVEYALPRSQLSIALSPEVDIASDEEGSGHHFAMTQVLGLGVSLSGRVKASAELAGTWDWDPAGTEKQFSFGGSLAYLVWSDVQIDAGIVLGLNRSASDLELYSGIAFRF